MKKNIRAILAAALAFTLFFTASAGASGSAPGSAADPFVSQSYVEARFDALLDEYKKLLDAHQGGSAFQMNDAQLDVIVSDVVRILDSRADSETEAAAFAPVNLFAGQVLIGGEGTEIILRSGSAAAWVPGQSGLSDVTRGVDVFGNEQIRPNHLLIVPRADGRGLRANTECWLLVKGVYTITN